MSKNMIRAGVGLALSMGLVAGLPAAGWAYGKDAGYRSCASVHGTVQTKGYTSPGSVQRHTHDAYSYTFTVVYGTWYYKYWNRGEVDAAWTVEALDYSGTGAINLTNTDGYCIY